MVILPIHESNDCHNPAGPGGGRFCSSAGVTPASVQRDIHRVVKAGGYASYGIRVDDYAPPVGGEGAVSSDWTDKTHPRKLVGTSAIEVRARDIIRALKSASIYSGGTLVLLGSQEAARGTDRDEIVMAHAKVLAEWELPEGFWGL